MKAFEEKTKRNSYNADFTSFNKTIECSIHNLLYKNLETPKMRLKKSFARANFLFSKRIQAKFRISIKSCGRFSETLIR